MKLSRERLGMALLFAGLPAGLYGFVIRPSARRMDALRLQIRTAEEDTATVQAFTPVSPEERAFLEEPGAFWRTRIARITTDADRLAHMNRVVSEVNATFKAQGVQIENVKGTWKPITANCTLPGRLARPGGLGEASADTPETPLEGWELEVRIQGPTRELFKALAAVSEVGPLLVPVGLRWEFSRGKGSLEAEQHQCLVVRNLFLATKEG